MKKIKKLLSVFSTTPLHPQWLIFRNEQQRFKEIAKVANGYVLDIGCAQQILKQYLSSNCTYIGLDYPNTAINMYETLPMLYGDAQKQPFAENTFDTISFLEVLEHLPDPQAAIQESHRILKPGGKLVFSIPFLYPIHDAPLDFQRLTIHGLRKLLTQHNFKIIKEIPKGTPLSTAMLLANIALVKTILNAFHQKHPAALLIFIAAVLIPVLNLLGWLSDTFGPADNFMPYGYTLHMSKELAK